MERDLGVRIVNYLFGFLGERWPWLTSDPALLAMITGIVLGGIVVGIIYWLVNKAKINERNAKIGERDKDIAGLKSEISFLERQKADLENKVKELEEQAQTKPASSIVINATIHYNEPSRL